MVYIHAKERVAFAMEWTNDTVNRTMMALVQQLTKDWTKTKVHSEILEIFMNMRLETKTEEEYVGLLLTNVAFATESSFALNKIFELILLHKQFPPAEAVQAWVTDAHKKIQEQLPTLREVYRKHFGDEENIKRKLELSYCPVLLSNRIKTDFIFAFIHEQNQPMMKDFFDADPKVVLEALHHISGFFASMILEDIELI
ncbi:hypothetical protein [Anoxybacillus sp. LAT_31]|uniref:hypothetical protein n=1 Tax=unclassified Anoxybacillus TaxID=2639704 RepID=UPI00319E2701|nr:hypothetical protein [Anoxybacillus sp. LAT_31]MCG6181269.1 hypothetical protein [Anoxybacillus sp. LAT_33]